MAPADSLRDGKAGHLAIITSAFWPEATGSSQTVAEFAQFAAKRGESVRVATAMPFYPEWRIWPAYRGCLWMGEDALGVSILRSWHFVRPQPSTALRIMHELTLSALAIPNVVRVLRGARLAYIVSPDLTFAVTACVLAVLLRVRRVLVVKDVMPDAAVELGMLRNPVLIAVSRLMARFAYAVADEIHVLGEGMRERVASYCRDSSKVKIVPDTIDAGELEPVPYERNEFRRRFVPDGTFAVVHSGNMGFKQDLPLLLRTAQRLRGEAGIHFYVFGDGSVKEEFLRARDALGLSNVSHFPLQERWLLPHMLSGADVLIVSQLPEVVDIVVPSKLITGMGAGAMVVAACARGSEAARIVADSQGGVWVPASDDAELAEQLARIRRGEVDTAGCRRRAREYALSRYDRDTVYGGFLSRVSAGGAGLCGSA